MKSTTRRYLAWALVLLVLLAAGVVAYPYVRYVRKMESDPVRVARFWIADRWHVEQGPGHGRLPMFSRNTLGKRTVGHFGGQVITAYGRDSVVEKVWSDGSVVSVCIDPRLPPPGQRGAEDRLRILEANMRPTKVAVFNPDGSLKSLSIGMEFFNVATVSAEEVHRLRTAEPEWPWWTKLPGFREHLSP